MTTLTYSGTLIVHRCWCGIGHAIPSDLDRQARANGMTIYCPLGHAWVITSGGKTLRDQLDAAEKAAASARADSERRRQLLVDERAQHQRTERRLQATRGVVTRTKRRIATGLCPRCHQHFGNVEKHMAAQHPDYVKGAEHVA